MLPSKYFPGKNITNRQTGRYFPKSCNPASRIHVVDLKEEDLLINHLLTSQCEQRRRLKETTKLSRIERLRNPPRIIIFGIPCSGTTELGPMCWILPPKTIVLKHLYSGVESL